MIYVDTNVFIRYLAPTQTPNDEEMAAQAKDLLRRVHSGELRATTSEVVLYELCWLLSSSRHFARPTDEICGIVRSILNWPGWTFPAGDLQVYYRALEIWESDPALEFSDSVIAARAEALSATLATFDRRLMRVYQGEVWGAAGA